MSYETVWASIQESLGTGSEQMDGEFVPISADQKAILEAALRADMAEYHEDDEGRLPDEYWLERLEATHWFVYVNVPELNEDGTPDLSITGQAECTWWDMGVLIAKQVDGEWYAWSEDPGDEGNIWYQTTYTKDQAYAVRDHHMQWAKDGRLYNPVSDERPYITHAVYEAVNAAFPEWA